MDNEPKNILMGWMVRILRSGEGGVLFFFDCNGFHSSVVSRPREIYLSIYQKGFEMPI